MLRQLRDHLAKTCGPAQYCDAQAVVRSIEKGDAKLPSAPAITLIMHAEEDLRELLKARLAHWPASA